MSKRETLYFSAVRTGPSPLIVVRFVTYLDQFQKTTERRRWSASGGGSRKWRGCRRGHNARLALRVTRYIPHSARGSAAVASDRGAPWSGSFVGRFRQADETCLICVV
ncbi:hypothetical protein EVAR_60198_1 [Eumeta japonica]|uniref:Uncharacterized protein n=1 Tax=Eumeta variegata TaxID=151549 RepID=A0A4C1ZAU2_EUMVA|nr:hypothetical protein EVAR_60198_1 [Eumeta japonica]